MHLGSHATEMSSEEEAVIVRSTKGGEKKDTNAY